MVTAGKRLRAVWGAALAREAERTGAELEFDERELEALEAAADAADRRAVLRRRFAAAKAAGDDDRMVKISGEVRQLDRAIRDQIGRIEIGAAPEKSERHARAARSRWERREWPAEARYGRRGGA